MSLNPSGLELHVLPSYASIGGMQFLEHPSTSLVLRRRRRIGAHRTRGLAIMTAVGLCDPPPATVPTQICPGSPPSHCVCIARSGKAVEARLVHPRPRGPYLPSLPYTCFMRLQIAFLPRGAFMYLLGAPLFCLTYPPQKAHDLTSFGFLRRVLGKMVLMMFFGGRPGAPEIISCEWDSLQKRVFGS